MTATAEATGLILRDDVTVALMQSMGSDHAIIAAARVSTDIEKSDEAWTDTEFAPGLIKYLMKNRHMSPFEHVTFTVRVEAPIFVFREWHRHRTQSYNEMSGRYTEMKPWFYTPPEHRPLVQVGKAGEYRFEPGSEEQVFMVAQNSRHSATFCWNLYQTELRMGVAKEVARRHLPLSIYSVMYATLNLRNAFQFLSLRTKDEDSLFPSFPQWEIEQAALRFEEIVSEIAPIAHRAWDENRRF